jgi:arsenate reductase
MTTHVLILCTHNSARSILGEAMLNHLARKLGRDVRAHSAGSSPCGGVNAFAIEALANAGVDTSGLRSKSWNEFAREGAPPLSIVITVCDNAAAEPCPVFAGGAGASPVRVHWSYPDPGHAPGSDDDRRRAFELTRQGLGYRFLQLLQLPLEAMERPALRAALEAIGHD